MVSQYIISLVYWKKSPVSISEDYLYAIKVFSQRFRNINVKKQVINKNNKLRKITRILNDSIVEIHLPELRYTLTASITNNSIDNDRGFNTDRIIVTNKNREEINLRFF